LDDELRKEIRKISLQNAIDHEGKTQDKIVLSKILGSRSDLRSKVKEITSEITSIVSSVNALTLNQQKKEVENEFPDLLTLKEKPVKEKESFPPLDDAEHGKVITRFPPEPNGYPHIGHAKAAIINEEYAKMYEGKLILRFDDTNPAAERLEYYAAIKVGLDWLGIKYDIVKNTSDDIELICQKGKEIINSNHAYVCTCKQEVISKNRRDMKSCKCSTLDHEKNIERWEKMFDKFKPGEAVVRFRGSMTSKNTVMRDPVLFRIIDEKHPLLGDKYRVWPSYDFSVAIEDSIDGVTHAFRTKEYELRAELYNKILDVLQMRKPKVLEFSRLEFKGMPVSKRILKPLIENGKVSWYDDPRLPTLEAMKIRGIKPEAIRKFILSLGFTKSDTLAPFDALESFNRKFVDATSVRLFMVINPRKLVVRNFPFSQIEVSNHPTKEMGKRIIDFDENLYLADEDVQKLEAGDKLRLLGLGNIVIKNVGNQLEGEFTEEDLSNKIPKIQWVSQKHAQKIKILIPKILFIDDQFNENSLEEMDALVEPHYLELDDGSEIQFVRFGYCRKDSVNQAVFTHK